MILYVEVINIRIIISRVLCVLQVYIPLEQVVMTDSEYYLLLYVLSTPIDLTVRSQKNRILQGFFSVP